MHRFFDDDTGYGKPATNIFKIYAPKIYYMSGVDSMKHGSEMKRDKQMMQMDTAESVLNEIGDTPISPEAYFNQESEPLYSYDGDYEPEPSNIVSRKLPAYGPLTNPYNPNYLNQPATGFSIIKPLEMWDSDRVNFIPGELRHDSMHDNDYDYTDYGHDMHDNLVSPSTVVPFRDQILLNAELSKPHFSLGAPNIQSPMSIEQMPGQVTAFIDKFFPETKKVKEGQTQYITAITFSDPELLESEAKIISKQLESMDESEAEHTEIEAAVSSEEDLSLENSDELSGVEIERNFIQTIYPDNTTRTEEIGSPKLIENPSSAENDIDDNVEEVEVNVVKTVLPDNSYLIGQAGGEDERIQDKVISMIQNHDTKRQARFLETIMTSSS